MNQHEFVLTGKMPLITHRDDVMAADALSEWRKAPGNRKSSVAGDDRSPPWSWMAYLYTDPEGDVVALGQENLMTCLRTAATAIPLPKGRGSYKTLSQSGMLIDQDYCPILVKGKPIAMGPIRELIHLPFADQFQAVKAFGFDLLVKRARVGTSKHVRVRPMFRAWELRGTITIEDSLITPRVLEQMFEIAGRAVGLGDWRPSAKESPGIYGTFRSMIMGIKSKKSA